MKYRNEIRYLALPGMNVSIISPINGCFKGVAGSFLPIRLIEFTKSENAPTGEYDFAEENELASAATDLLKNGNSFFIQLRLV